MRVIAVLTVAALVIPAYAEDPPKPVEVAGMKATPPTGWKSEKPSNTMRIHQFKLPREKDDSEDAELAVFFFATASGSVEQNLKRQVAKFNPADGKDKVEEKVDKIKVGPVEATYQDVSGTFVKKANPMAKDGTPMPNYRQLYVVFETKDGQYYMTLLGPAKTVEKHKKDFESWLESFK